MRKIGINLFARSDISIADYIRMVKDLGFDSVFCLLRPQEVMYEVTNLMQKAGLTYDTLYAPCKNVNALWYEGDDGDNEYSSLTHCIDMCTELGAPIAVVHMSYGAQHIPPSDIGRARFINLVDYAAKKGVRIAFENISKLANLAWAFEEFAGADNVGFCYDCGHEACFTPGREYLPFFGNRLICTHIHDNDGVKDLHLLPFDGNIDFCRVTNQIRQTGFQGTLMLEVSGNRDAYQHVTTEAYLMKASKIAMKLRDMIDRPE
ncbi:MAG: sugar phosphate isomerase/epimerase [Clostridia bacterium]|nr:sugar phosphate isomerase/epimerase [Clostridia bacterium]